MSLFDIVFELEEIDYDLMMVNGTLIAVSDQFFNNMSEENSAILLGIMRNLNDVTMRSKELTKRTFEKMSKEKNDEKMYK